MMARRWLDAWLDAWIGVWSMRRMANSQGKTGVKLLAICAACALAYSAAAQSSAEGSHDVVWAWFQMAWEEAEDVSALAGNVVLYETQGHMGLLPPAELAALKRAVEGRPDHPDHRKIALAERRRDKGPDITLRKYWVGRKDQWRYCQSPTYTESLERVDWAGTSKHMWRLNDHALSVFAPGGEIPPGEDPRAPQQTGLRNVRQLVFGGLNSGQRVNLRPSELSRRGDLWVATAIADNETVKEYVIRWDAALGRGFIESSTTVDSAERLKHVRGYRDEFSEWQMDERLGRWVAARVDQFNPAGVHMRSIVLDRIDPVSAADMKQLVKVPTIEGEDPDRGAMTITRLYDYRPNKMEVTRTAPDGTETVQGLPGAAQRSRLRILGMVSLAGLVLLFVVLRARRAGVGA